MEFTTLAALKPSIPDHYATLGLHRGCTDAQIRAAYRLLAKQHHPDMNGGARDASARTQELNAAYETLGDAEKRQAYDDELALPKKSAPRSAAKTPRNLAQDVLLRLEEFLRGTKLEVHVNDPGNPDGAEMYQLTVPPETAPGTRFRIERAGFFAGGFVSVRVKARPDFRFKVRGSDLRCDLKINFPRAQQGGVESIRGVTGSFLRVTIPKKVSRGEIVTIAGGGLPKPRGGRGDLLVRILYHPAVQIKRATYR
jgi:DnaJ-class molecular chaperone